MKNIYFFLLMLTSSLSVFAQNPVSVTDVQPSGDRGIHIVPSLESTKITVGNTIYFVADENEHGRALWKYNTTTREYAIVKDVYPGVEGVEIRSLVALDNKIYFASTNDVATGKYDIYVTDGTEAGTVLLFGSGATVTCAPYLHMAGSKIFFTATIEGQGTYLYSVNGSAVSQLQLIWAEGGAQTILDPQNCASYGGYLFFMGYDAGHGQELWRSDGTAVGTALYADMSVNTIYKAASSFSQFVVANNQLFFIGGYATELLEHSGIFKMTSPSSAPELFYDFYREYLSKGSFILPTFFSYNQQNGPAVSNGVFYFSASRSSTWPLATSVGSGLARTDGTASGTYFVQEFADNSTMVNPEMTIFNGKIFFDKTDISGRSMWLTDGTENGTYKVGDKFVNSGNLSRFYTRGNRMFVTGWYDMTQANRSAIWSTDGTNEGTVILTPDCYAADFQNLFEKVGDSIYFQGRLNGCTNDFQLNKFTIPTKIWLGKNSTDWNDAGNWDPVGVPANTDDIVIPGGITNYPLIASDAAARNLWINWGSVNVAAGVQLTVHGELSVVGSLEGDGTLVMATAGNDNLHGSGAITISSVVINGSDVTLKGDKEFKKVQFLSGNKITLGDNNLVITDNLNSIVGYKEDRFFVTNGSGSLTLKEVGSSPVVFPVGTSITSYNPLTITNTGDPDNFKVRVIPVVYQNGNDGTTTSSKAINRSWLVDEAVPGGSDVTLTAQWNTDDELNGFNKNEAYLSHFTNDKWDEVAASAVTGSNPFLINRSGLNSFSPFAVFSGSVSVAVDPPAVNSFTPASGPVGTSVTITGQKFNDVAANNIVYFGAVRATVTGGSATSLNVIVPAGATYQPISVLDQSTGLTGYSADRFITTFDNPSGSGITQDFYKPQVDFSTESGTFWTALADVDGDCKSDMVITNTGANTISVLHNISTSGSIAQSSFGEKVDFAVGADPTVVAVGDLDGDGKPDLVVANRAANSVSVLHNTSTSSTIDASSFAAPVSFACGSNPISVAISDLDGDGKPDIAVANYYSNTVSILHNSTTTGTITTSSFADKVDFETGREPAMLAIEDLNGDGKAELAVSNFAGGTISVLPNTCTKGVMNTFSFAARIDFATGDLPYTVSIGDLDADNKPELVVVNVGSNTISVFHNTSVSGGITANSFDASVDFATADHPVAVAMGDLDGDGKVDLAVTNQISNTISVYHNNTSPGSITATAFDPKVDFATVNEPVSVAIGDLDGDGKPEMATSSYVSNTVSVLQMSDSKPAGGLKFDGVNDYVDLRTSFTLQNFTAEMWVKPESTQVEYADIIDNNHVSGVNWVLQQKAGNTNAYYCYFVGESGEQTTDTFTLTPNVWQHVALVKSATEIVVYVNGVAIVRHPLPSDFKIRFAQSNLTLGRLSFDEARNWNGSLDEVRLWSRPLCAEEIRHYMNNELPFTSGNSLIRYYKANSGVVNANNSSSTVLVDETGVQNGTLVNFALSGVTSNWTSGTVTGTAEAITPPVEICDGIDNNCDGVIDEGCPARALNFDGVDDYVSMAIPSDQQNFTIEMWINPGSTQRTWADIIDNNHYNGPNWVLQQKENNINEYYFYMAGINGSHTTTTFTLLPNVWQHLSVVKSPTQLIIYVNAVPVVTSSLPTNFQINYYSPHIALGNLSELETERYWNGSMDEVRYWNRPLCQTEIQHYMNGELPFTSNSSLMAYYKANAGVVYADNSSRSTLIDETGSYNGTLHNFDLSGSFSNWTAGTVSGTATVSTTTAIWYRDSDNDGHGSPQDFQYLCSQPAGYVADNTDCNDNDRTIYTGATEVCDGKDNDCDGQIDEGVKTTFYRDSDGDSFGNRLVTVQACTRPTGYVIDSTDCNDNNASIRPTATEVCGDGIDNNCDGQIDEGCTTRTLFNITSSATTYESSGTVNLTVTLSKKLTTTATVSFATANVKGKSGVATAGSDYKALSGTLTFAPGAQTATITIQIYPDLVSEPNEIFTVTLSKPVNAAIGTATSTVTIVNGGNMSVVQPEVLSEELAVKVNPNPTTNRFRFYSQTGNNKPLQIRVFDNLGRIVEVRSNVMPNSTLYFGERYRAGIYFIEVIQGNQRRNLKVIKGLN